MSKHFQKYHLTVQDKMTIKNQPSPCTYCKPLCSGSPPQFTVSESVDRAGFLLPKVPLHEISGLFCTHQLFILQYEYQSMWCSVLWLESEDTKCAKLVLSDSLG